MENIVFICLHLYIIAEREEGELHKLEVLHSEWNSNDGNTEYDAPCQMGQGDWNTSYKPPYHIHYTRKTPRWPGTVNDFGAEWP